MKSKKTMSKVIWTLTLGILFLTSSQLSMAQNEEIPGLSPPGRIEFSLGGGFAHAEDRNGMVDLKAEFLFTISSNFKAGFGVGYLSDFDHAHMGGNFGSHGGMMGGIGGMFGGDSSEHRHDLVFTMFFP
jgi:hypothetical protein